MGTRTILGLVLAGAVLGAPVADGETVVVDGRPAALHVPVGYDPSAPTPLVLLLHGYSSSGALVEAYMAFTPLADQFGFLYLTPDGTVNCLSNRFWSATDACCNFCGSGVDDSGYLRRLIEATESQWNVDPDRVFLIGHSNGGFMSYRAACDHADRIAALVSLAGATFQNPAACAPSEPVHTLQIHGTLDGVVLYGGGLIGGRSYPGAPGTVERFATYNGCSLVPDTSAPNLDLDASILGSETLVTRFTSGCAPGGSAELWTMVGGGHLPILTAEFRLRTIEFLLSHPKPGEPAVPLPRIAIALAVLGALLLATLRGTRRASRSSGSPGSGA
jgi:polyhydroxybutyrate depolymerase